jgi:hypothetical protein
LRLTLPWLFQGFFGQYWALVVIALAFTGLGLSEWFNRRGLKVLAEPVSQTSMFLPFLPVLAFWWTQTPLHFSALLLLTGLFYGIVAFQRRSFVLAVVAAVSANGALWYAMYLEDGYGFLDRPQLWLIPFALSVLIAAHFHRQRLQPEQTAGIRYVCLGLIYFSSTAEMFVQGVAEAPWLPLVLVALSVAGVLAGIVLRVRSFLFAGCGFLVISLLTILWHASTSLGWTWIWYVAGIALGVLIIFMFATFEHRRKRVLEGLARLKEWEV